MKVKVISLPYIFQVLYVLCFTRPRYQVSVYRTIGPLVYSFVSYLYVLAVADQLPRLGKRELAFLLSFTCNYIVSVRRGFLFLLVLGIGCVILLWHSLCLPYNYFRLFQNVA